jgi:hypothetical protein
VLVLHIGFFAPFLVSHDGATALAGRVNGPKSRDLIAHVLSPGLLAPSVGSPRRKAATYRVGNALGAAYLPSHRTAQRLLRKFSNINSQATALKSGDTKCCALTTLGVDNATDCPLRRRYT